MKKLSLLVLLLLVGCSKDAKEHANLYEECTARCLTKGYWSYGLSGTISDAKECLCDMRFRRESMIPTPKKIQ